MHWSPLFDYKIKWLTQSEPTANTKYTGERKKKIYIFESIFHRRGRSKPNIKTKSKKKKEKKNQMKNCLYASLRLRTTYNKHGTVLRTHGEYVRTFYVLA